MTLEEAKEFYFQYNGYSFHMDREEPAKYSRFRMLHIGEDTLREWDEELLEGLFERFRSDPARAWVYHGDILKIIGRGRCDTDRYMNRLLDAMEQMKHPDLSTVTLIVETMAGRTESMKDGGVYILCGQPGLAERMNRITERLIAVCAAEHGTEERFEEAVRRYRRAYEKWKG